MKIFSRYKTEVKEIMIEKYGKIIIIIEKGKG